MLAVGLVRFGSDKARVEWAGSDIEGRSQIEGIEWAGCGIGRGGEWG